MALPELFKTFRQPLHGPIAGRAITTAAADDRRQIAKYTNDQQRHDQWCWAAVGCNIAKFYDGTTKWNTQCIVASAALGRDDCCDDETPPACNQPWYLDRVLMLTENLRSFDTAVKSFDDLCTEVDEQRPFACRIGWIGGGGHFVVITGYDRAGRTINVRDPLYGDSTVALDVFVTAYKGTGRWTHSYETQSAPRQKQTKRRSVRT